MTPTAGPRVVVLTGAASGIGHATAELFRDLGDVVFGLDISPTVPDGVTYVECNVAQRASVEAAIATCVAEHGRIDVLANIAGVVQFGRFETITDDEWDRVHAIDLKGPFMVMQAALPYLKECRGNIVNVSSVAGLKIQPYTSAYAAAKGGLTMMTKALACEFAEVGVRVNAVCPGQVDTPIVTEVANKFPDRPRPPGDGPADGDAPRSRHHPGRARLVDRLPRLRRGPDDHRRCARLRRWDDLIDLRRIPLRAPDGGR